MTGGSIEHNFALGSGGGVYVEGSNVGTIENCYVRGHRAEEALDIVDK